MLGAPGDGGDGRLITGVEERLYAGSERERERVIQPPWQTRVLHARRLDHRSAWGSSANLKFLVIFRVNASFFCSFPYGGPPAVVYFWRVSVVTK